MSIDVGKIMRDHMFAMKKGTTIKKLNSQTHMLMKGLGRRPYLEDGMVLRAWKYEAISSFLARVT